MNNTKSMVESGFVAGTPVWTEKGLVPIEQIRVGDRVLSMPESGTGELVYKPVVNTFVHVDKEIWSAQYYDFDTGHPSYLYGTANHPIWIKGKGWTSIDTLRESIATLRRSIESVSDDIGTSVSDDIGTSVSDDIGTSRLEDGRLTGFDVVVPVFATVKQDTGFRIFRDLRLKDDNGECIDFSDNPYLKNELDPAEGKDLVSDGLYVSDGNHWYKIFQRHVFNIEVEDFHTYFVGQPGVWVHG